MNCPTHKIQYGGRREAVAFAKRSKGGGGKGNQPYRCQECGFWHLGRRMPKHAQRSMRRYLEGRFEDERRDDDAA